MLILFSLLWCSTRDDTHVWFFYAGTDWNGVRHLWEEFIALLYQELSRDDLKKGTTDRESISTGVFILSTGSTTGCDQPPQIRWWRGKWDLALITYNYTLVCNLGHLTHDVNDYFDSSRGARVMCINHRLTVPKPASFFLRGSKLTARLPNVIHLGVNRLSS